MPYCWQPHETLGVALRRIAGEQVDKAIAEIEDDKLSLHESVHQLRKRCKKIRGLIRLVRPAFSDYSAENAFFRDLAGTFSELRDAEVMRTTLDAICRHYADEFESASRPEPFEELREWLTMRKTELADATHAAVALEKACETLAASKPRIEGWLLDEGDSVVATAGVAKTYQRGRKGMQGAAASPTPECLHEWRKRVKYHRYHLRLLTLAWPPVLLQSRKGARDLSDWLGEDHDLSVFRCVLGEQADELGKLTQHSALLALFARRAADLRNASFSLGRRVFAETSKAHGRRLGAIISAWRSDQITTGL